MAEFNYGKESDFKLATKNDDFYRFIDIDGNVRLIKDTGKLGDEGFVELSPVDGSEIRSISNEDAGRLIPNDLNPLTVEEKAKFPEVFEQFDTDVNGPSGNGVDNGGNTIIGGAGQRDGESAANYAARSNPQFSLKEQEAMQQGDGILAKAKSWWNKDKEMELGAGPLGKDDIATADSAVFNPNATPENTPSFLQNSESKTNLSSTANLDQNVKTDFNPRLIKSEQLSNVNSGTVRTSPEYGNLANNSNDQLMKDSLSTKDQNDNSWGSADGWNAAGSVMKGVGGLASAYTGMQNYKLARDAFGEQKRQWDANYGMRLKSYNTGIDQYNQKQQDKLSWRKRTGMGADKDININSNDLAKV